MIARGARIICNLEKNEMPLISHNECAMSTVLRTFLRTTFQTDSSNGFVVTAI